MTLILGVQWRNPWLTALHTCAIVLLVSYVIVTGPSRPANHSAAGYPYVTGSRSKDLGSFMARVTITLTAHVRAPSQDVFEFVTAKDVLPKILLGYGPLPDVASVSETTGPWNVPGSARVVYLENGSSAREELTDHQPSSYFAYCTSDFTSALKYVVSQGRGQWWFTPDEQATEITQTYTFTARSWFMRPTLMVFVSLLWRGYMRGALREVKAQVEQRQTMAQASIYY